MTTAVTSIGTVLIDCFQFLDEKGVDLKPPSQQIGGGGLFAIVGARVWLQQPGQARILVDSDGSPPEQVCDVQRVFGDDIFVWRPGRATGSAAIVYRGQSRTFEYINQPAPISPRSFVGTPLVGAKFIHMCTSPAAVLSTAAELAALTREADAPAEVRAWKPAVVWEPHPKFCVPEELEAFRECLAHVDVVSPNHEEAAALFSLPVPETTAEYERLASLILASPLLPATSSVVVRCGALGSVVGSPSAPANLRWVPAFWTEDQQHEVRDVTGAGNSFLGGLIAGLSLTGDIYQAAMYASVSASFVVQQFGLPVVERSGGATLWNGEDPLERLEALRRRLAE